MNKTIITVLLLALLAALVSLSRPVQAQAAGPTPTYDPLGEPALPPNPTQLDIGRHLYWRHCMPCHGDVGQGLTPEFLALWQEHSNCWARGCHSGKQNDEGFPIPTRIPALAGVGLQTRYTPDTLFQFLRATHPPQDPGLLSDDDYRALVLFLYHLNDLPLLAIAATASPSPTSSPPPSFTPTPHLPPPTEPDSPLGLWPVIGLAVILTVLVLLRDDSKAR